MLLLANKRFWVVPRVLLWGFEDLLCYYVANKVFWAVSMVLLMGLK